MATQKTLDAMAHIARAGRRSLREDDVDAAEAALMAVELIARSPMSYQRKRDAEELLITLTLNVRRDRRLQASD